MRQSAYQTETKHEYAKHPAAICFFVVSFCLLFDFFQGKNADLGFRSLTRKIKTKKQKQSALVQFDPFCFFFGFYFCGLLFFFLFIFFPIICLFPVKCSMLRHNRRPDPW